MMNAPSQLTAASAKYNNTYDSFYVLLFSFATILFQKYADDKKIVLAIGAGPTGLSTTTRLPQRGRTDWLLIDQAPEPGGLACTDVTPEGFLFDMGGHVNFSQHRY